MKKNTQITEIVIDNVESGIRIQNTLTNKSFIIQTDKKLLRAVDIFNILNYSPGDQYVVSNKISDTGDKKNEEYYNDIIGVITEIINEINEIEYNVPNVKPIIENSGE